MACRIYNTRIFVTEEITDVKFNGDLQNDKKLSYLENKFADPQMKVNNATSTNDAPSTSEVAPKSEHHKDQRYVTFHPKSTSLLHYMLTKQSH